MTYEGGRPRGMREFMEFINLKGLRDLSIGGLRYTWSNMQERPKLSKLDRFFLSSEWDELFPFSKHESLPRSTSDHVLILLNRKIPKFDPRPFKFENTWLRHPRFKDLVGSWWS